MTKGTISIATLLALAACSRQPVQTAPVAAAPAPAPQESSPVVQQAAPVPVANRKPASAGPARLDTTTVKRRASDIFGNDPSGVPEAAPADATATNGPSWDIEVHEYESTDRVEHYVRLFSTTARERIENRLERGTRYEAMIRSRMREGGIPEDMYYLALIESGFDPNAYSRAAAVGMWQFMTSTGRDMGLRVDWWVDERRDPFKSTTAAVRFIKGLRDQFGSLYLAAAAYNGGPGRIARGLTRYADDLEGTSGDDLFFALAEKDYLRNETREYVPQLIAAALIAKEPEKYGMKIDPQPALTYDSVRVGPATAIAAVAKAANVGIDDVRELNPHILRGVTPPRDSFFVRVPTGTADSAAVALADMPKSVKLGLFTMESKKGDNFESIARKNGVSTRLVAQYNPKLKRLKSGNLAPGQTVLVPTAAVVGAAVSVPDPEIERYGPATTKSTSLHVVRSGETLGGIAKKYGTTTKVLLELNNLRRPLIFPGQSLVVKGSKAAKSSAKSTKSANTSSPKSAKATSAKGAKASASKSPKASAGKAKAANPKGSAAKPKNSSKKATAPKKKSRS